MSTDEERRKVEKPNVSIEEACKAVLDIFGICAEIKRCKSLDSYDDANFLICEEVVSKGGGRKFVCKYHNGVESANSRFLDAQNSMMLHLDKLGFVVPCPIASTGEGNKLYARVKIAKKEIERENSKTCTEHAVRLLKWVEGNTLATAPTISPDLLCKTGTYLAALDGALDTFKDDDAKGLQRTHLWDLQNFEMVSSDVFTKPLHNDLPKHTLLKKTLSEFKTLVLPLSEKMKLRKGIVHGDFNDANIVLSPKNDEVGGVIDFGDSTISWRVNDPAIAMAYVAIALVKADQKKVHGFGKKEKEDGSLLYQGMVAFLKGYIAKYKLTSDELSVVLVLARCRVATSATLGW
eukprot:jgi/Bigna1/89768/estExt_fgenesh1_pg.C_550044